MSQQNLFAISMMCSAQALLSIDIWHKICTHVWNDQLHKIKILFLRGVQDV